MPFKSRIRTINRWLCEKEQLLTLVTGLLPALTAFGVRILQPYHPGILRGGGGFRQAEPAFVQAISGAMRHAPT